MQNVKLLAPALVGLRTYEAGEVVEVTDHRARDMIAAGQAVAAAVRDVAVNADSNPLGDTMTPIPPRVIPIDPSHATSPHVGDHPGLTKLVEVLGVDVGPDGKAISADPVPTHQVASAEQVATSHALANPTPAPADPEAKPKPQRPPKPGEAVPKSIASDPAPKSP